MGAGSAWTTFLVNLSDKAGVSIAVWLFWRRERAQRALVEISACHLLRVPSSLRVQDG